MQRTHLEHDDRVPTRCVCVCVCGYFMWIRKERENKRRIRTFNIFSTENFTAAGDRFEDARSPIIRTHAALNSRGCDFGALLYDFA